MAFWTFSPINQTWVTFTWIIFILFYDISTVLNFHPIVDFDAQYHYHYYDFCNYYCCNYYFHHCCCNYYFFIFNNFNICFYRFYYFIWYLCINKIVSNLYDMAVNCSKLGIKTVRLCQWFSFGVFDGNFEHCLFNLSFDDSLLEWHSSILPLTICFFIL